jgi:hypothetical protein
MDLFQRNQQLGALKAIQKLYRFRTVSMQIHTVSVRLWTLYTLLRVEFEGVRLGLR